MESQRFQERPLVCCIHAVDNFHDPTDEIKKIEHSGEEVSYTPHKIKSGELMTPFVPYVFSSCDEKNKYTCDIVNCTTIIGIGLDPVSQKNISFMSHQHPYLYSKQEYNPGNFESHLREKIRELVFLTDDISREISLLGGNYVENDWSSQRTYVNFVKRLSQIIKEEMGDNPLILNGPNSDNSKSKGDSDIFLETQNKAIHVNRYTQPFDEKRNEAFDITELSKMQQVWKNKVEEVLSSAPVLEKAS